MLHFVVLLPLCDNLPARTFPTLTLSLVAVQALLRLPMVPGFAWAEQLALTVGPSDRGLTILSGPLSGWHLVIASAFLWWFGGTLEGRLGAARFVALLVSAALIGASIQTQVFWLPPFSLLNLAVSGVLGAYITLYPRAQLLVLVPAPVLLVELPAIYFVGLWLLLHAVAPLTPYAWTGHLEQAAVAASFVWGWLYALAFAPPVRWDVDGFLR